MFSQKNKSTLPCKLSAFLFLILFTVTASEPLQVEQVGCTTASDCALNGICTPQNNTCACYAGWKGNDCSQLDLVPAAQASGLHLPNVSSWGGSVSPTTIATGETQGVHLFASVFQNCGLTSWIHNSFIAHTYSAKGGFSGAFLPADNAPNITSSTAIPVWAHNVVFINATTDTQNPAYLIFHIGDGKEGPSYLQECSSEGGAAASANGTSQCGLLWFSCDPPPLCEDMPTIDGFACVSYACSGNDNYSSVSFEVASSTRTTAAAAGDEDSGLGDDVDCGVTLADLHLSCVGADECAFEAAGACAATEGCVSFAISAFLNNYTWVKLFTNGVAGTRPNAQWNTWVNMSAITSGGSSATTTPSRSNANAMKETNHGKKKMVEASSSAGSTFPISFSTSLDGPWTTVFANTTAVTNANNPAPFIARNGSVFVVFNDGFMSLFRSDSGWQGPYNKITIQTCGGGEDPFIWIDANDNWHCLYHRAPFSDPANQAIGHAYSTDGFSWTQSPGAAATSLIEYESGSGGGDPLNITFGKRERPHLVFDVVTGDPIAFVSGVGINPACDPFVFTSNGGGSGIENSFVPSINETLLEQINAGQVPNCGAWVQYQRLDLNPAPGFFDRSWTHVQLLRGSGSR